MIHTKETSDQYLNWYIYIYYDVDNVLAAIFIFEKFWIEHISRLCAKWHKERYNDPSAITPTRILGYDELDKTTTQYILSTF